jgi:ABC-type bacteriocin/lantibiotic exporter with double-glycine peptidase domain
MNVQPYIFKNNIQLNNVAFSYKKTNKLVLNNISFEIKKNQCLGIIGASGAGKSTLIDLILGLIRIKKGVVKIDGKTIDPNIDKWKNLVGYVPQNIFLLEDTIKNNILFGDSNINPIALEESIEFANLSAFVNSLPNGIETKIGEHGNNLSGGQLQRIGIARALYKKPEILILDEATSALDNKTEIEILSTIEKLKTNTTVIIITHRKSSLRICDSIIKIHKGQILKIK